MCVPIEITLSSVASWFLAEAVTAVGMGNKVFNQGHITKDFCLNLVNKLFAKENWNPRTALFLNCLPFSKKIRVGSSLPTVSHRLALWAWGHQSTVLSVIGIVTKIFLP